MRAIPVCLLGLLVYYGPSYLATGVVELFVFLSSLGLRPLTFFDPIPNRFASYEH